MAEQEAREEKSEEASSSGGAEKTSALNPEQIQNAVAFLTHPKVRESTEASKREFLAGKGLSEQEIEEAFKRAGGEFPFFFRKFFRKFRSIPAEQKLKGLISVSVLFCLLQKA